MEEYLRVMIRHFVGMEIRGLKVNEDKSKVMVLEGRKSQCKNFVDKMQLKYV